MDPLAKASTATPYWHPDLTSGWLYLLPPLATRRVLCLSAQPALAAAQAKLFLQLTLLLDDRIVGCPPAEDMPFEETSALRWSRIEDIVRLANASPAAAGFDGLIVHDPEGDILHQANFPRFEEILRELRPALRPGAFVYVGVRHAYSLQQLFSRATRPQSAWRKFLSVSRVRRSLRTAGFADVQCHPYLMWGARLAELIPKTGYRATKNREILRERAKELVFGRIGSRVFAPAYGLLAFAGTPEASTLDQIMSRVAASPYSLDPAAPVVKQYLVFSGDKAIISFGPAARDDADVVAILAGDALAIERRQAEGETLARLASLPSHLSTLIPRLLDQITIGRTSAFVLNRFPGVTLDLEVDAMEPVTDRALSFIADLHLESARPVFIDDTTYQAHFGSLIDAAAARNPSLANALRTWHEPLRANLMGKTIPTVWMHGDFKVENVLYDPASHALTGVIDWEHAMLPGLPLVDPLYLLIYNRMIRGVDWTKALTEMLVLNQFSPIETARLRRYMSTLNLPEDLVPALCAAFIAHHIGCRVHLGENATYIEPLRQAIVDTRHALERHAALSQTPQVEPVTATFAPR